MTGCGVWKRLLLALLVAAAIEELKPPKPLDIDIDIAGAGAVGAGVVVAAAVEWCSITCGCFGPFFFFSSASGRIESRLNRLLALVEC